MASSSASAAFRPAGAPSTSATDSAGAPSTSATDSAGAPSTSATDSAGAPSTSATDSARAPSASAASTSATDSAGAPSASAASTSATDSAGAPSASAASTSATDSAGAPSASAASTSATDSAGAPSASAASTSATDSEGAPSASAASTSDTDSEGAPSASAASTSDTDSEGAPPASAASTSDTDSEGAPSASAASTSDTDSEGAPSASAASTWAATETAGSTAAPIPPSTSVSMDADKVTNSFNDFLIDDSDEEEEGKDEAFGALEIDVFPVEEVDLAVLLSDFKKDFVSDGLVSSICIRSKKLLESAIKAISRVTFCWNNSPYIEFVGEDGDDLGGPQREFFRLLRIEVQTSMGIFEGKAGQVFLTYDQAALDGHKYFQAGRLIAWSVAHGGPCSKALDPSLYQLMCGQEPQLEQFDCSVLPDPGVQSRCKTAEDLYALQKDLGDWISECGVPGIFSATIGEIPKIYAYVVKHYIFLRTAKMVNQLTEGMNAFGNLWDLVRNNWIAFLPCFTNMRTPLTKSSFKAILKYEYSPRGTNHQEKEEDTIYSWGPKHHRRRFIKRATRVFSPPWSDLTLDGQDH
ncbi:hypothetical protein NQZ68_017493 [Dissostichus eleginoides]|nr:hypothetical protein NQZ68_017493 [Dissostichus eleginoides]